MELSKILVIGATGYLGKHIAEASLALCHPTYLLVRPTKTSNAEREKRLDVFKALGAVILNGSLDDYDSLLAAIRQVEVVISAVGHHGRSHTGTQLADQAQIIAAIQEAGTIKRFLPSEFGVDVDRDLTELMKSALLDKVKIRRAVEKAGIPYTFVSSNNLFRSFLDSFVQNVQASPSKNEVLIYGDGNTKAVYVAEEDVSTYIIKAVDDPRTENQIMYIRPPANVLSQNEVVALWEQKIGKTLEKRFLSEEEIIKQVEDLPYPENLIRAFAESIFVRGVEMFEIGPRGVEATTLYDEVNYTTVDEYLDRLVSGGSQKEALEGV